LTSRSLRHRPAAVIDPVNSHFDAKLDPNQDTSVRAALTPLAHIAQSTGRSIVLVHHLKKSSEGTKLMHRALDKRSTGTIP
jgi:RecA-family ATPase